MIFLIGVLFIFSLIIYILLYKLNMFFRFFISILLFIGLIIIVAFLLRNADRPPNNSKLITTEEMSTW